MPSPFTSPITTEEGSLPVTKSVRIPKLPAPALNTETVLAPRFAVTTSGMPSPFTSPIATE